MFKKATFATTLTNVQSATSPNYDSSGVKEASVEVITSGVTGTPSVIATLQSSSDGTNFSDVKASTALTGNGLQAIQVSIDNDDYIGDFVRVKLANSVNTSSAVATATLELK